MVRNYRCSSYRCSRMKKKLIIIAQTQLLFLVSSIFLSTQLWASGLEYTPVNPSFGGNPLNGNTLLNSAQSQNKTKDPSLDANGDALEDFNDRLQRINSLSHCQHSR